MHRLLQRQIAQARGAAGDLDTDLLLGMVDGAYEEADQERRRTDRSITLMIEELEQVNAEMRASQALRFEAAVNNMSHGLTMFDSDGQLVICNAPFARMFDLPEALTRPGTTYWELFDYREARGLVEADPDADLRPKVDRSLRSKVPYSKPITLRNGQVMRINYQPLEDGGWLMTYEDETERHRKEELIRHLAQHDGLTGVANRNTFVEALAESEDAILTGTCMAVLCIDLDHFKAVNDRLGHAAGDIVLGEAARRIARVVGEAGLVARVGGDEFAALLTRLANPAAAGAVARAIIDAVSQPIMVEGSQVHIGASIGIAMAPGDGVKPDVLMRRSDLALYAVKTAARGEFRLFDPQMDTQLQRRRAIEVDLREALQSRELWLDYQPIITLADGQISCCEALMRWSSPFHGKIGPDEFIPVAEDTGLIRELGEWAVLEACNTAAGWPAEVRLAVNISPMQFVGNGLLSSVKAALAASGLAPERLELEITESLLLANTEHNLRVLHALKALGVRIALDDFGTGFSALSYLRRFPFDRIKIDRSFIANLCESQEAAAIVGAVVQLGRGLGMPVTAEGVETAEQLEVVQNLGCSEVQGFLFGLPMRASGLSALLVSFKRRPLEVPSAVIWPPAA